MLEILWPSGALTRLSNLKSDQIVTIKEGEGLVGRGFPRVRSGKPVPTQHGTPNCVVGQLRFTSIEDPTAGQSKAPEYRLDEMS